MAFGGYFNPNYTLLPNQQGPSPQLPPSPQGPMPLPPMPQIPQYQQPAFSDMFSMPFMSMPFMPYYGGGMPDKPAPTTAPQVPQMPTQPPAATTPPQVPTVPTTPAPVNKPGYTTPAAAPVNKPGYTPPTQMPTAPPLVGAASSAQQAGQNWMSQYNSPEYAAWYNSLPPSTKAFATPPGNQSDAQNFYNRGVSNYNAFGNNTPWTPRS